MYWNFIGAFSRKWPLLRVLCFFSYTNLKSLVVHSRCGVNNSLCWSFFILYFTVQFVNFINLANWTKYLLFSVVLLLVYVCMLIHMCSSCRLLYSNKVNTFFLKIVVNYLLPAIKIRFNWECSHLEIYLNRNMSYYFHPLIGILCLST